MVLEEQKAHIANEFQEVSLVEAFAVTTALEWFNEQGILYNMPILPPYHRKCNLVTATLRELYLQFNNAIEAGIALLETCVSKVSSCQKLEHDRTICTDG